MAVSEISLPPLNWLRAFEASARLLSFTAAASELNMTQSAVSQQIKSLEQHVGRPLFIRRPRSIQLTDTGYAYLPVVQEAFETLVSGTRMVTGGDRGQVLTVQSNLAFSVFWLAPRLGSLLENHPWLKLNITTATWEPNDHAFDVEIRFGINVEDRRDTLKLAENTAFPVCTPEFRDRLGKWQEANLFDCTGIYANWEGWAKTRGEALPTGKAVNLASTFSVSLNAALGSVGLAMGHEMLVDRFLEKGCLVRPYVESIPMREAYYLIQQPDHAQTPASRAFLEWLLDEVGTQKAR